MSNNRSYRKIIHVDMDAFYASVEQRDDPDLKGQAVAVGGSRSRGVVAAASYEARKYGVHSAMPSVTAFRRCPDIVFVKPRFDVYKAVSLQIHAIFEEYTDLVEPLSLDEAYLDVTENKIGLPSATLIAKEIKKKVFENTGLTCSAGISINKFLAKTASDINKPDGITLIKPDEAEAFIEKLKIEKFFGIGKVTAKKMKRMGIHSGFELKKKTLPFLVKNFGKAGKYYFNIARAIDNRIVNPDRQRKSISVETTFDRDLNGLSEVIEAYRKLNEEFVRRISKSNIKGKTLVIKIKYADFTQVTRNRTSSLWIDSNTDFIPMIQEIFKEDELLKRPIRLLGVGISSLNTGEKQAASQLTIAF